jgi:DNA modification methylase
MDFIREPAAYYSTGLKVSSVFHGDAEVLLKKLPADFFKCCITSPPYRGLRDYNADGQIGAEDDPHDYIQHLISIFEEVRGVLTADGTLWLNIGDSDTSSNRGYRAPDKKNPVRAMSYRAKPPRGLKPKDLVGIPWRVAFALQQTGWHLRSDIIWEKPNCMPESVKDRPTRAHEYIFLFSKSPKYY